MLTALPLYAQNASLPPITVGGGAQTSFVHNAPDEGDDTDQFLLNSARLYINGPVTDTIKFMFNTEYNGATNSIGVLDAVAQFGFSERFNIWAGRFLPPSDRANLYGPYYSHHWSVYTDGVQDGYPFVFQGRDNGVAYWGQFGKLKASGGAFDGDSATGKTDVIWAGRLQLDLWDAEPGYYLNGTFYGDKNILGIGLAGQVQDGNSAWNTDLLVEKKLGGGGTVSLEGEYAQYEKLGGYNARYQSNKGGYILGAYLFPKPLGTGRFELLGKFADAKFSKGLSALDENYEQKTTEINVNYLIKQFNARVMFFFKNTNFDAIQTDFNQVGIGLQVQM